MNTSNDWQSVQQELWRIWRGTFAQPGDRQATVSKFWSDLLKNAGLPADAATGDALQRLSRSFQEFSEQSGSQSTSPFAEFAELFSGLSAHGPFGIPNVGSGPSFGGWQPHTLPSFADLQDMPPLGILREWHASHRQVTEAQLAANKAGQALTRQLAPVYQTALKRFTKAINANEDGQDDITSLRELYDLWVSLAEQAYSETVMKAQYAKAFGKYINANARLRLARQTLFDDVAEAMNLPNRRELNAIIERQHTLEAQIRELTPTTESVADREALQHQVEYLTQRLEKIERPQPQTRKTQQPAKRRSRAAQNTQAMEAAKRPVTTKKASRKKSARSDSEFDIGVFDNSPEPGNH